jgi:hypothetical protein
MVMHVSDNLRARRGALSADNFPDYVFSASGYNEAHTFMKLRLHRNSIRLRLTPSDVERLVQTGQAEEVTRIAPGVEFAYCLKMNQEITKPRASFAGDQLCVQVPSAMAQQWAQSEQVGLHTSQETGEGRLEILVEKDFECLDGENVSDEEFYPNPGKVCQ